ncbi:MAG: ParB/RepB/Spo0J family partition protein [Alphaproteobacteria bacterium]|nr:ParB/RepB/Spo0J family partition protein [Alphaproteobacteria bacterium]
MSTGNKHLGKGLSDLMKEKKSELSFVSRKGGGAVTYLPVQNISPNPYQPRRIFNDEGMEDLIRSVEVKGILQPILVRPKKDTNNLFEIIAGERRWRAAQAANFREIPAIIKNFTDREILEVAIIENLQREDMTPIDEAQGFQDLHEKFGYTYKEIASRIGKSQSYVSNHIRLLSLPKEIQNKVQKGEMSASHARTLLSAENDSQEGLAQTAATSSVRELEKEIDRQKNLRQKENISPENIEKSELKNDLLHVKLVEYEKEARKVIGKAFKNLSHHKEGKITIEMEFENFESLSEWLGEKQN